MLLESEYSSFVARRTLLLMQATTLLPRTPGLPLVGHLLDFRADRLTFLGRARERWGDIARCPLGPRDVILINEASYARQVLIEKEAAFHKGPGIELLAERLLGQGLLSVEGQVHRRYRRLVAPAFQHRRIEKHVVLFGELCEARVSAWRNGEVIDLHEEMMALTLRIVTRALLGAGLDEAEIEHVQVALDESLRLIADELGNWIHIPLTWPTPRNLRLRRARRRLETVLDRIIRERLVAPSDVGDLLSMLLLARDESGDALDARELRDQAMTIFLAGHETTANALTWCLQLIAANRDVEVQIRAELERVLGGRPPRIEDLASLPYTSHVLKESLRLYPPAYALDRRAIADVEIGEYRVPRDSVLFINIFGIHRRPDVFDTPDRFRPERWAKDMERTLPRCAYMPFGAGPRTCIGNHFALLEAQVILATLLQRVRLQPLCPVPAPAEPLVTMRPRGGVPMRVRHFR